MNKEKEVEKMARIIKPFVTVLCEEDTIAEALVNAGYGNVKQAVKEFVKRVGDELENMVMEKSSKFNDGYNDCIFDVRGLLDTLITELYGADE